MLISAAITYHAISCDLVAIAPEFNNCGAQDAANSNSIVLRLELRANLTTQIRLLACRDRVSDLVQYETV